MVQELRRFRASLEASKVRTDTFMGREHLVVPVVALVQGVIHPSNAESPELALSQEFGKIPSGWDGRPLVLDHPQVDGHPTVANQPKVLEDYQFGFIFNTRVEDDKLKTEAWIAMDRVDELGGAFKDTVNRINNGEVVEVSTGFFADVDSISGSYQGARYAGVYRNFVPDHLAILTQGKIGACSVAGGCGAPRLNSSGGKSWPKEVRVAKEAKVVKAGGDTEVKVASLHPPVKVAGNPCQCQDPDQCQCEGPHEAADQLPPTTAEMFERLSQLYAATIANNLLDRDVRAALQAACSAAYGPWVYVIGFTQEVAVYVDLDEGTYNQIAFNMDGDGNATFTGEPQQVRLMTRIILAQSPGGSEGSAGNPPPVTSSSEQPSSLAAGDPPGEPTTEDEGSSEDPETQTQEVSMSEVKKTEQPRTPTAEPAVATQNTPEQTTAAAPQAATVQPVQASTPSQPVTLDSYVAAAPAEFRDVLVEGLRIHNERKAVVIQQLKSTNRCDFSDDSLARMPLQQLEGLAKLAGVNAAVVAQPSEVPAAPATFDGRAVPQPVNNSAAPASEDSSAFFAPPPLPVFEKKTA